VPFRLQLLLLTGDGRAAAIANAVATSVANAIGRAFAMSRLVGGAV